MGSTPSERSWNKFRRPTTAMPSYLGVYLDKRTRDRLSGKDAAETIAGRLTTNRASLILQLSSAGPVHIRLLGETLLQHTVFLRTLCAINSTALLGTPYVQWAEIDLQILSTDVTQHWMICNRGACHG